MSETIKTVTHCPACGARCTIEGSNEGTQHYVPQEEVLFSKYVEAFEKMRGVLNSLEIKADESKLVLSPEAEIAIEDALTLANQVSPEKGGK